MKNILALLLFGLLLVTLTYSQPPTANESQLAFQYYQNKEYDKAIELFRKLYENSNSKVYFGYYINCLIELKDYKNAEKIIRKQLKGSNVDVTYFVDLGYLYKAQNDLTRAQQQYEEALEKVIPTQTEINKLANAFTNKREYDYAEKVYLYGRKQLAPVYSFHLELANLYTGQRNYPKMIEEYLDYLNNNDNELTSVQDRLQYYVVNITDEDFHKLLKTNLLKRIQSITDKPVYTELLIWVYIQEKNFEQALFQAKALDRRNNEPGNRIIELGQLASANSDFEIALKAYQYVIDKGKENTLYMIAKFGMLDVLYEKVLLNQIRDQLSITNLEQNYLETIKEMGEKNAVPLIKKLAHIQAFYLNKAADAILLLENALKIPRLTPDLLAECKLELGDILLLNGDIWEATLIYAQVEKQQENTPIGHEAKFRKAKLAYYAGNFKWAQAQLDILKASTSKLISNDALDLSLLISENTGLDSTETALRMYAAAELLFMQNKDSMGMQTLDSISERFVGHPLSDEIIFKKAKFAEKRNEYEKACELYLKVVDSYSWDILADDALFAVAQIYELSIKDIEKAMTYYKRLLTDYAGSIFVVEARKRYRTLRGDFNNAKIPNDILPNSNIEN